MLIGAVADDITGATDLSLMLAREGLRTVQIIGLHTGPRLPAADAVVIALKSRSIPAAQAVEMSVAAAKLLRKGGRDSCFSSPVQPLSQPTQAT